jgi:hypothetical protein
LLRINSSKTKTITSISGLKDCPVAYVYPPGRANPVVYAVAALNPAACVAEINVGRCRIFIGKSKFDKIFLQFSAHQISTY